jgi:hypothetical protein
MCHTDPADPGLFDEDNDFDWDAFFNFEPDINDPSFSPQDISLTQWEPLDSAFQDQPPSLAPATCPGTPRSLATKANLPPILESSTSRQLITNDNGIKQNQTKRGIQDFLSSFFIDESSVLLPSKRQAFSPSRRTEVARVRKIKACQRCKMRKLSASLHLTRMSKDHLLTIY